MEWFGPGHSVVSCTDGNNKDSLCDIQDGSQSKSDGNKNLEYSGG